MDKAPGDRWSLLAAGGNAQGLHSHVWQLPVDGPSLVLSFSVPRVPITPSPPPHVVSPRDFCSGSFFTQHLHVAFYVAELCLPVAFPRGLPSTGVTFTAQQLAYPRAEKRKLQSYQAFFKLKLQTGLPPFLSQPSVSSEARAGEDKGGTYQAAGTWGAPTVSLPQEKGWEPEAGGGRWEQDRHPLLTLKCSSRVGIALLFV